MLVSRRLDEARNTVSMGQGGNALDDRYAINAAKTKLREGYNNADVEGFFLCLPKVSLT